jgi:hypothetical protein
LVSKGIIKCNTSPQREQATAVDERKGDCSERIYVATPDDKLWSIDALTGARCAVDLLAALAP